MNPGQGKRAARSLAKLQAQCDAWNAANHVGCNVVLTKAVESGIESFDEALGSTERS